LPAECATKFSAFVSSDFTAQQATERTAFNWTQQSTFGKSYRAADCRSKCSTDRPALGATQWPTFLESY
jgi:hypothetical protein